MAGIGAQLRHLFTQNLGYKIVALLLALLLWFDVTSDETAVIEYPVPLSIAVEGRDMIITNDVPHEVDVRFSGSGKELLRLDKDRLAIRKEVRGGESDTIEVDLSPQDVQRPVDLNVVPTGVSPGRITVVTDRFIERSVPVEPVGAPRPEGGGRVVGLQLEPRSVTVRGVTAEVRPIASLTVDLSRIEPGPGAFDERLEVLVPDTLRTVRVTPDSLRVRGRVEPLLPEAEGEEE